MPIHDTVWRATFICQVRSIGKFVRRRPSPGTCIVGYQIVAEDGVELTLPKALLRTLLGFIALCAAYLAPFVQRDRKNGKFWLDKVFRTQAVTLT